MPDRPVALFTIWPELAATLRMHPCVLFLDFDGTLLPLTKQPDAPRLSPGETALLDHLARAPGWTVAIVSGRALSDVRRRVHIPGLIYAGNHGLEIEGRGLRFRHPGAVAARKELAALRRATSQAMGGLVGVKVENKGLSWTVHFRGVAPAERHRVLRTFWSTMRAAVRSGRVCIRQGVMSREVLPPVEWDKGAAVRWILARLPRRSHPVILYIGDDAGDEPAFAALGSKGVSVVVGRRQRTRARFFVRNPGEVQRLLCLLAQLQDATSPHLHQVEGRGVPHPFDPVCRTSGRPRRPLVTRIRPARLRM